MDFYRQHVELSQLPDAVVVKWNNRRRVLEEGYLPLPKTLLRYLPKLFRGPARLTRLTVLLTVIDYKRPDLKRPPSIDYLAFTAGMKPDKFLATLDRMQDDGWVKVTGTSKELEVDVTPFLKLLEQRIAKDEQIS